ncbi:MAG: amidase family protein [Halovenus sp.]
MSHEHVMKWIQDGESGEELENTEEVSMKRRGFLGSVGLLGAASLGSGQPLFGSQSDNAAQSAPPFDPFEPTVGDVHRKYRTGQLTVRDVVEGYLDRIESYEEELDAIIRINPSALERADELDEALESGELAGPLHGIPLILKDNNDTADIPTTAGSVSLDHSTPPDDATIVSKMRDAGAVILAKANLSEFAFSYDSISSFGGTVKNPYDTERHAGGSSGGTGATIAANLGMMGTGTDTGGSVRVPSAACSLVGLRPTTGLISRDGIVPLSLTEDTAGPMARTVADAARFTDVMAGYDPADPETSTSVGRTPHAEGKRYTDYLRYDGLESRRIGVYRDYVGPSDDEEDSAIIEDAEAVADVFDHALEEIEAAGATVVDPVEAPSWDFVYSANVASGDEFNRDIDSYLEGLEGDAPEDLEEIAESGEFSPAICSLREREEVDEDAVDENLSYLQTLSRRDDLQEFVHSTFVDNDLDAVVYPALTQTPPHIDSDEPWGSNAQLSPALEFPSMTVPAGFTAETEMPVGIEFMTREYEEAKLFEIAYAYEQNSQARQMPDGYGSVESDVEWSQAEIEQWNESQHKNESVAELGGCEQ